MPNSDQETWAGCESCFKRVRAIPDHNSEGTALASLYMWSYHKNVVGLGYRSNSIYRVLFLNE